MARKLLKAGWIQLISALRPVMGYRQCLLLEQMISEMIVVTAMAVNVYVRLRQEMMESVTWMITKAIVCTNSDNLVNNNFKMYFFAEQNVVIIKPLTLQSTHSFTYRTIGKNLMLIPPAKCRYTKQHPSHVLLTKKHRLVIMATICHRGLEKKSTNNHSPFPNSFFCSS